MRIADVTLPNGRVLEFEVRFGDNAVSERMPQPSRTGICQVNLGNQNTRIVEREDSPAGSTGDGQREANRTQALQHLHAGQQRTTQR